MRRFHTRSLDGQPFVREDGERGGKATHRPGRAGLRGCERGKGSQSQRGWSRSASRGGGREGDAPEDGEGAVVRGSRHWVEGRKERGGVSEVCLARLVCDFARVSWRQERGRTAEPVDELMRCAAPPRPLSVSAATRGAGARLGALVLLAANASATACTGHTGCRGVRRERASSSHAATARHGRGSSTKSGRVLVEVCGGAGWRTRVRTRRWRGEGCCRRRRGEARGRGRGRERGEGTRVPLGARRG